MEQPVGLTQPGQVAPNLLILGAAKSGTSSLYRYLSEHPDIFMSPFKEPTFFVWADRDYDIQGPGVERVGRGMIDDLHSYLELFSNSRNERIRGEASTGYLHTPGVAERIRHYVPEAKLMAILRNPVDRAYSAFLHARRNGFEPISDFEQAVEAEPERVKNRWIGLTLYTTVGMYAEQLERYLAVFPSEQIRVYLYEDLVRDPIPLTQDAFRFLEVDDTFESNVATRYNAGRSVRSPRLHLFLKISRLSSFGRRVLPRRTARLFLRLIDERPKEQLQPTLRQRLTAVFETDVSRLSRQLGRDLSPWLEGITLPPPQDEDEFGMHPRPVAER